MPCHDNHLLASYSVLEGRILQQRVLRGLPPPAEHRSSTVLYSRTQTLGPVDKDQSITQATGQLLVQSAEQAVSSLRVISLVLAWAIRAAVVSTIRLHEFGPYPTLLV